MQTVKIVFLTIFGVLATSQFALANTTTCERTSNSWAGFTDFRAFESWFPKTIVFEDSEWKPIGGQRSVRTSRNSQIYQLLPNGKLVARILPKSGYQDVNNVRYNCDRNAKQIALGSSPTATPQPSTGSAPSSTQTGIKHAAISEQITSVSELKKIASRSPAMSASFWKEISQSQFIKKYVGKSGQKALAGAFPKSCNYRYYSSGRANLSAAINKATSSCQTALAEHNRDFGKDCKCSLIAINNTFIYSDVDVYYFNRSPEIPFFAEIESPSGIKNVIRGDAVFLDINAAKGPYEFIVKNERGSKVCEGVEYPSSDFRKGKVSVACFDGKMMGHGEYQVSDFDHELKTSSGSVFVTLTDGSVMRAIYGKDARR